MENRSIKNEFNINALNYDKYNIIQKEVARLLIDKLEKKEFKRVLDLGCGSGEIYKLLKKNNIKFEEFVAIDFSSSMCNIHPKDENVKVLNLDFDKIENLSFDNFDIIISSSALQWSSDIFSLLKQIRKISNNFAFNIFSSNTFNTIWNILQKPSPIYSKEDILKALSIFDNLDIEILNFKLNFNSKKEMFDYIKKSGVGFNKEMLSYKEAKKLYINYPNTTLEFEIIQAINSSFI